MVAARAEGIQKPDRTEDALRLWARLACSGGKAGDVSKFLSDKLGEMVNGLGAEGLRIWASMAQQASSPKNEVNVKQIGQTCHLHWKSKTSGQALDLAVLC